jgi:2-methylcitrate dehydratase PrpD
MSDNPDLFRKRHEGAAYKRTFVKEETCDTRAEDITMTVVARDHVPLLLARRARAVAERGVGGDLDAVFRLRLLDFAANVGGGAATPASSVAGAYTSRFPGRVPSPPGGRTSAEAAALAYGVAAHVLECDDTHQPSSTHPGAVVFSAAFPLAVEIDATVGALARAVVAGYETMCLVGEAAGPAAQYELGFHPTGTCGVFGSATAAGILLDLPPDRLAAALALATSVSAGSMSFLAGGGWSKLLNTAHAASAGLEVALLANHGFEAPLEAVDRPHGFLAGHSAQPRLEVFDRADDAPTALERTSVKTHGCCRYEQGPIDAILQLRAQHSFAADDVSSVRVGVLSAGWGLIAEGLEEKRRPATVQQSQFSMPFGAALAIVRGRASPADHAESNLRDPAIQRVMDVVECYRDPSLDARYPAAWPASVEIELGDGTQLRSRLDHPRGDPENPLSYDEVSEKLVALAPDPVRSACDALMLLVGSPGLYELPASVVVDALAATWAPALDG